MNQTIGISYLFSPYKMYIYGRQISNFSYSDIHQSADLKYAYIRFIIAIWRCLQLPNWRWRIRKNDYSESSFWWLFLNTQPFKQFSEVKRIAFITNFDQRDLIAFETFFNTWKSFHFSVSLIHLTDSKDTWNEIKLAGIKEYFHKQYPGLEIHYDVVMNDNLLKGLDQYIKDNQIDIITLTS